MHPERGPVVFTTQDQLFAHFAEEHANPENKGDEGGIISYHNFGTPSLGQENNDTRLVKLRHSNVHPMIPSGKEQILTTDNTKNPEDTQLFLGDSLQDTVAPKILILRPFLAPFWTLKTPKHYIGFVLEPEKLAMIA